MADALVEWAGALGGLPAAILYQLGRNIFIILTVNTVLSENAGLMPALLWGGICLPPQSLTVSTLTEHHTKEK